MISSMKSDGMRGQWTADVRCELRDKCRRNQQNSGYYDSLHILQNQEDFGYRSLVVSSSSGIVSANLALWITQVFHPN